MRPSPSPKIVLPALLAVTLLTRIPLLSRPYYVDGPSHIVAIEQGSLFIQAPGYFLFNASARLISAATHLSAAQSISALNVAFSLLGVTVFYVLAVRLFPGWLGIGLAFCYALSNVVWFTSEIHSTYAAMTFFAPLLLYVMVARDRFAMGCIVWALLAGFRPSDGVFLLPFLLFMARNRSRRELLIGFSGAVAVVAVWYIPTMRHFGGDPVAPLIAAGKQVNSVAGGVLAQGMTTRALVNVLHFSFGLLNSWNILLPFLFVGLFRSGRWALIAVLWMLPAFLFFCFYFISDTTYMAFTIAPGMILAAYGLSGLRISGQLAAAATSLLVCLAHMLAARPVGTTSPAVTVVNCYSFEYTAWALRHQYMKRLYDALKDLRGGETTGR